MALLSSPLCPIKSALERKYHEQLEALELEHAAESKLIRSHHAKQTDTQRRNLVEQLELNERLRTEVMQKSQVSASQCPRSLISLTFSRFRKR